MNAMKLKHLIPVVVLGCIAASAQADHEMEGRDTRNGAALYAEHCAACHGKNLEGQPNWQTPGTDGILPAPPHDETGHTWHHDSQLLFDYTQLGGSEALSLRGVTGFKSGMPAFEGVLDEAEIWDILAYLRSTWPQRVREIQSSRNPIHD